MKLMGCALALAVLLTGCTRFELRADGLPEDSVYFTSLPGSAQHFEESDSASFLFWGLMPLSSPRPANKINPYLRKGVRMANFSVTTQTTVPDVLVSVLTLGIYSTRTVRYEGDLVTY